MMLKMTCCVLCCAPMLAHAGIMGPSDAPASYDGIYAGVNLGLSNLLVKEQHLVTPESHQLGSLGVIGGGYVGYDYPINQSWDMLIEGFGNATGLNVAIIHAAQNTAYKVKSHYNAGLRLLPTYQFTPGFQGHLIFGYANAQFKITDSGEYGYLNTSFHKSGFQTGLGWTTYVWQGLLFRVDAMYTTYGTPSSTGNALPGTTSLIQTYSNGLSTLEGDLALVYKF